MRCPYCSGEATQVKDSRPAEDNTTIRRRRVCPDCGGRFTTHERVQLRELVVVKRSGRKVPFDRDKLLGSVVIALRKRPVEPEQIDRMVSGIVRQLESQGDVEVPSQAIGSAVMDALRGLDPVGYVRFASVYRDFREAADFVDVIGEIAKDVTGASADETAPKDNAATDGERTNGRAHPPANPDTHQHYNANKVDHEPWTDGVSQRTGTGGAP